MIFWKNHRQRSNGAENKKTIIIVGVARGGTSIVSGSLAHLGVFSGNARSPVFEDLRLSLAFEKNSNESFDEVIQDYNQRHDIWAWKRPSTLHELKYIARKVINPHFIFVFRDLFSIARRNNIAVKQDMLLGLKRAHLDYAKIIKFIGQNKHPAIYISSEKAVSKKESFIDELIQFCGISPSKNQITTALDFISPNPTEYLQKTRIDSVRGWIDYNLFKTGIVKGWVNYIRKFDKEIEVELWVNNKIYSTAIANIYDKEYVKPHISNTGKVGFYFDLNSLGITKKDQVEVRAKGDVAPFYDKSLSFHDASDWLTENQFISLVNPAGAINKQQLKIGILMGWAVTHSPEIMAKVAVYINGKHFATLPACIYRPHLNVPNIHPTGHCGYQLDLKPLGIQPCDEIEVKLENSDLNLTPDPISFPHLRSWLTPQELHNADLKKQKTQVFIRN